MHDGSTAARPFRHSGGVMRVGRSFRSSVIAFIATMAGMASSASAMVFVNQSQWTGSRSTPAASGITATGGDWPATGLKLSWNITYDGSVYTYVYTLTDDDGTAIDGGAVSHFKLEVSPTF